MGGIQFNAQDVAILYVFPKPATDLRTIVWYFTSTYRAAPPAYEELATCLTKGLRTGIVREDRGRFVLDDAWYDRIHGADDTAENEIEAMLEFESRFVGRDVEATNEAECTLTEAEYASIVATLR